MDVISDKQVKTRKSHRCYACNRLFPPGTIMHSQTNTFDGISTIYSCQTCDTLMSEFSDSFYDDGEQVFPSECVNSAFYSYRVNNPEELLNAMRKEKQQYGHNLQHSEM